MKITLALISMLITASTFASISKGKAGSIIAEVIENYSTELVDSGLELEVDLRWDSEVINQGVTRKGYKARLTVHGGIARKAEMTADAFALVVCHEVGHLIGGAPSVKPSNKFGSEGQSDYFASSQCIKRYLKNKDNKLFLADKNIPKTLSSKCSSSFNDRDEQDVCLRTGLAILAESHIYHIGGLNFENPSQLKVEYTIYNDYPNGQCRVDTQLAGALNQERPRCWFNPETTDLNETPYNPNEKTYEAEFIGTVTSIEKTITGCNVKVKNIDYYRSAYIDGLDEDEFKDMGIDIMGKCDYSVGQAISGTATLYGDKIYRNVSFIDL